MIKIIRVMGKFIKVKEAKNEKSNCGVVALQYAHNLSYEKARQYAVEKFSFKERKGMSFCGLLYSKFLKSEGFDATEIPSPELKYPGSNRFINNKNPEKRNITPITLNIFLEKFPKNKYLVEARGHLFVVDNGNVVGTGCEGKRNKIEGAWLIQ